MKKISIFTLLVVSIFYTQIGFAQFSDTQKDSLNYMYRHGIIDGYPDGTFRPKNKINRAELVKIIMDASHKKADSDEKNCFPDVKNNQWYAPYICTAKINGWIEGYPDKTFQPEKNINKVEALKIMGAIQNWGLSKECMTELGWKNPYKDTEKCSWYFNLIVNAEDESFIDGGNYFYPGKEIMREEVAEILFRTLLREKLGRISKSQENAENTLAAKARDFFIIEKKASEIHYKDIDKEDADAKANPVVIKFDSTQPDPSGKYTAKPIDETRKVLTESNDGNIYGVLHFELGEDIKLETIKPASSQPFPIINILAKFDQNHKLIAYDWRLAESANHYADLLNIISAKNDTITVESWQIGASIGDFSKGDTMEIFLENVR